MSTRKIGLVVAATFLLHASAALAGAQGPESIDLKKQFQVEGGMKAVIFPHRIHQAKLACSSCHLDPGGGGKLVVELVNKAGIGNDFHKKFCWPCHVDMKVPQGKSCSTCHG